MGGSCRTFVLQFASVLSLVANSNVVAAARRTTYRYNFHIGEDAASKCCSMIRRSKMALVAQVDVSETRNQNLKTRLQLCSVKYDETEMAEILLYERTPHRLIPALAPRYEHADI